jgi:hypothetical protein
MAGSSVTRNTGFDIRPIGLRLGAVVAVEITRILRQGDAVLALAA